MSKKEELKKEIEKIRVPADKINYDAKKNLIADGGFFFTYKAQHVDWGTFAFKKLKATYIKDIEGEKLMREAAIQKQLNHPNIVTIFGMVFEQGTYGLLLEYMKFGDVKKFLNKYKVGYGWKLQIVHDVALGMNYLHTQPSPITHADLKTQNILIGNGFNAKIADFGFCEWKEYSKTFSKRASDDETVVHIPPENWREPRSQKSQEFDVYGFGIAAWEIFTQAQCYNENAAGVIGRMVQNDARPDIKLLDHFPLKIKQLVHRCWDGSPQKRPTFSVIKKDLDEIYGNSDAEIKKAKRDLNKEDAIFSAGSTVDDMETN